MVSWPYVTSGRVWNLGSVTFVNQSSACGGWLGVLYCSLSSFASCTGGGLIRSTCLFHSSQVPVPLISFCGSVDCMSKWTLPLICFPSVDFHWEVHLLDSCNPCLVVQILVCGFISRARREHSAFFFFLVGVVTRSSARTWQNEGKKTL